ncbi:3-phosphoserine/phosphohydroxythreonine transaminase [Buchnera aphidicola]|uniref:3-phosphoserine/phosphohydroxythreonine transaminase n=1 Tax=Buchnera aphidicola TaxID=9 RepID=UPI003464B11F
MKKIIYNFSAGPAMLPQEVLIKVKNQFLNWNNIGSSIIEISHRSSEFLKIIKNSYKYLKKLLSIPDEYIILFCQGGARGQFSAVPMNLLNKFYTADYINSGYWSYHSMVEASKYCTPYQINVKSITESKKSILPMSQWNLNKNTDYVHYCPNETIEGIAIHEEPNFQGKIVVGDFSSSILSRSIDVKKYGVIYASAQKNIGPAGITLIIMRRDLLKYKTNILLPTILNYKTIYKNQSMFNTPNTFSWYVSGLVFKWMIKNGGISFFEKLNYKKAKLLYQKIDSSNFYINDVHIKNRSYMNVVFNLVDQKLNDLFLKESIMNGLNFLKGHKFYGGFRASIYNAMPISGVKALIQFMTDFEYKYK